MDKIGERIKRRRETLSLQLNDLARKVGISSSALSQIEKAKSYPSILTLKLIAENLQTTVGDLIGENESLFNNPVNRKDENELIQKNISGAGLFTLSQKDLSKQMDTFRIVFDLNGDSLELLNNYSGQFFGYVVSGEIQFDIDNKSYVIQPGDTVYFNSKRNFRFLNISTGKSELLCVCLSAKKIG